MFDAFLHRVLRVPYTLNVQYNRKPKKPRATVLFIHGIGNSGEAWDEVIKLLPSDVRVITIDLLGFGTSPRPSWAIYDVKTQVRSVIATLIKLRITKPMIIVGHSLGALVAVEFAKQYPKLAKSLLLCSPPLYDDRGGRILPKNDRILMSIYRSALRRPDKFVALSSFAMKYNLVNPSFNVTAENVASYMETLRLVILNQTTISDIRLLRLPITVIYGRLDLLVIPRHFKKLAADHPHITVKAITAGHEVRGTYVSSVARNLMQLIETPVPQRRSRT